ncbi:MAG TPA: BACON domain-containing protein [Thermoanaerobaculia bacterium]|nr:BACON domain-containing protein [Thermoanaerobaculia bacterium]
MKRLAVTMLLVFAAAVSLAESGAAASGAPTTATGRVESRVSLSPALASVPAVCTPSNTALCANNGRFEVQVVFSAPNLGITNQPAQAVPMTSDTGHFWFFSPNNVELVVKVVDGRAFNGFFWVFYGALSDVAYTVTVTDTATGVIKSYSNPAGTLASVADTAAFSGGPSCTYTVGAASPASFGPAGGTGTATVATQAGCSWTAVSNSPFVTITSGASGTGNGTVTFSVAANASGTSRNATLTVAGETLAITQSGAAPGQFDGSWSGTTSQACDPEDGPAHLCALTWVVSNNAIVRLQIGFAGPACGVPDAFTTIQLDPPQPITGSSFQIATTVTASPGVSAAITLNGSFVNSSSSTGSGSVRLTTSSPQPNCSTTSPISFTTARN